MAGKTTRQEGVILQVGGRLSYTEGLFKWHMQKIHDFAPAAIQYLHDHHNRIWYRCGFSEDSKCDYLTNNVSESFNSRVKHMKGLLIHELVDGLREMVMEKRYLRRKVGREFTGDILPSVIKEQAAGKEEEKDSYQEEAKESCLCT